MHRVSWIIVGLLLLVGIASAVDYVVIGINGAWINSSTGTLNIGSNINMDGRSITAAANVSGTNANFTNYTTSQGRHLENGGCDASYCIGYNLTNSSIIEAINGTTGERDYSGDFNTVFSSAYLKISQSISMTPQGGHGLIIVKGDMSPDSTILMNDSHIDVIFQGWLTPSASFPEYGYIINVSRTSGSHLNDENQLDRISITGLKINGSSTANGVRLSYVDHFVGNDWKIIKTKGEALDLLDVVRESDFYSVETRYTATSGTNYTIRFWNLSNSGDQHNNIRFYSPNIAYPVGGGWFFDRYSLRQVHVFGGITHHLLRGNVAGYTVGDMPDINISKGTYIGFYGHPVAAADSNGSSIVLGSESNQVSKITLQGKLTSTSTNASATVLNVTNATYLWLPVVIESSSGVVTAVDWNERESVIYQYPTVIGGNTRGGRPVTPYPSSPISVNTSLDVLGAAGLALKNYNTSITSSPDIQMYSPDTRYIILRKEGNSFKIALYNSTNQFVTLFLTNNGNLTMSSTTFPSCITMKSPDGTSYKFQLANGGTTNIEAGTCT